MKKYSAGVVFLMGLGLLAAFAASGNQAAPTFEKFKALEGKWQGKRSDGKTVRVSYEVVSAGSAVLERLLPPEEPMMITVYHLDGDDLVLTHYCAAKNQPRMKAGAIESEGRVVSFQFVDATNLARASDGHMHNLEVTFESPNRLRQKWTWQENGKKEETIFELARVR